MKEGEKKPEGVVLFKKGEARSPESIAKAAITRAERKMFSKAARVVAMMSLKDLQLRPDDPVAIAIMKKHALKAVEGSVPSARYIADRAEGTPRQSVDFSTADNQDSANVLDKLVKLFSKPPESQVIDVSPNGTVETSRPVQKPN